MAVVLILTAGFGEGHNAAARSLRDALIEANPELRVEVRDIFAETYGWLNRLSVRGYLLIINHLPGLWSRVFEWLDRSPAARGGIGLFGKAGRHLLGVLEELKPVVIASTYPGCNLLLDALREKGGSITAPQVTVVTDSLTINSLWHAAHSDWFVVPNAATADAMQRAGVPAGKLKVLGFPVSLAIASERIDKVPPAEGERWKVLFMVNSGKRIAVHAVQKLAALPNVELTVTVGRDHALEAKIRQVAPGIRVFGWTTELYTMMTQSHLVVSKAGGATVQECLAAGTPMIVSQVVPGQEEGNARLIVESGAGAIAETADAIAKTVAEAFADAGARWRRWHEAVQPLSRPEAARDAARFVLEIAGSDVRPGDKPKKLAR